MVESMSYTSYEGLNHLMMPEDSDELSVEIYDKENHLSQDVINDLAEFFK